MVSRWHYLLSANKKMKTKNFSNCPSQLVSGRVTMRNTSVGKTGYSAHLHQVFSCLAEPWGRWLCECGITTKGVKGMKCLTKATWHVYLLVGWSCLWDPLAKTISPPNKKEKPTFTENLCDTLSFNLYENIMQLVIKEHFPGCHS